MRHVRMISRYKDVVIQMDPTYWGRNYGLMVIKDALRGKILWHKYVRYETVAGYMQGVEWLEDIHGIVCDGLRGLFKALSGYRVQMCQVHQQRIVRTYLTRNPELEASRELLELSNCLTSNTKETFVGELEQWHERWKSFLSERSTEPSGTPTGHSGAHT